MTIEVIKKGNTLEPRDGFTCKECEGEFRFQEQDIRCDERVFNTHLNSSYFYVECPACGREHKLSPQKLGREKYDRLKKKFPKAFFFVIPLCPKYF